MAGFERIGVGRPAKRPAILAVRELTAEEVRSVPREMVDKVKTLRDRHHRIARLLALGLRPMEIGARLGYSPSYLSQFQADPAMQELVAFYRQVGSEHAQDIINEYQDMANKGRNIFIRQMVEHAEIAEEKGELLPFNQLVSAHADLADRTGYPKLKTTVNLNMDFASRLDQAVRRSAAVQVIDEVALPAGPSPADPTAGGGMGEVAPRVSLDAPPSGTTKYVLDKLGLRPKERV